MLAVETGDWDEARSKIAQAKEMNASTVTLVPQPNNKFDDRAVAVQIEGLGIIGMIPKTQTGSIVRSGQAPIVRMERFRKGKQDLWSVMVRAVAV